MIIFLYLIIYGTPILIFALFIWFIFKKTQRLKPTENSIAFLLMLGFFIIIPFLIYLASIFYGGRGFFGYYMSLPIVLRQFLLEGKIVSFLFYLISIHILGLLPLLAIFQFIIGRNKLSRAILHAHNNTANIDKGIFEELESLVHIVKNNTGITNEVKIKLFGDIGINKVIGSLNCAIMKFRNSMYLIVSRKFLGFFSKKMISREEMKAILSHEFAHIVHTDYFVPIAARIILNRTFILTMYFSFSVLLAAMGRYPFMLGPDALHKISVSSFPYPFVLLLAFLASWGFVGAGLEFIALSIQRCEILADNLAIQFVPSKVLKNAVIKMSMISEASNPTALSFSSNSLSYLTRHKCNALLEVLKDINFFAKRNRLFYHPSLLERIKAIDNPRTIIEEEATGLLNFELFGAIGVFTMVTLGFTLILLNKFVRNINWQDVNWLAFSYIMYFWLVFLVCSPLRYTKKPFAINKKNIKLIAVYSLFITISSNLIPLIMWWSFILQKMDRSRPSWHIEMFIRTQISHSIERLVYGFIFSLILFGVFLSGGSFVAKRKTEGAIQK